jgi:hypothetical protein
VGQLDGLVVSELGGQRGDDGVRGRRSSIGWAWLKNSCPKNSWASVWLWLNTMKSSSLTAVAASAC